MLNTFTGADTGTSTVAFSVLGLSSTHVCTIGATVLASLNGTMGCVTSGSVTRAMVGRGRSACLGDAVTMEPGRRDRGLVLDAEDLVLSRLVLLDEEAAALTST